MDAEKLFTARTLFDDDALAKVLGRRPDIAPATLPGHAGAENPAGLARRVTKAVAGGILTASGDELAAVDRAAHGTVRRRVLTAEHGVAWAHVDPDPIAASERIAVVGDSIAYGLSSLDGGWSAALAAAHTRRGPGRFRLFNLAWPGAELGEVLASGRDEIPRRRADTVLIAAGINDLNRAADPADVIARAPEQLDAFAADMEAQGRRVVAMTPLWQDPSGGRADAVHVRRFGETVLAWAARTHRDAIDMYDVLEDRPELLADGLHPTEEGHRLMLRRIVGR